ncbi:CRISPR-associated helicase Cas3' [Marinicrinis sediminis]|uniref:CRISPR-associated helicase Cas3 n=1 Tax=Marinicrinis sediminis TaxID=1652465 RepID=A0ABW5R807_9BACL
MIGLIYYAKSQPVETIKEHTEELLNRFRAFKVAYQQKLTLLPERDWQLLEICVRYHDAGKADLAFQRKIRKSIDKEWLDEVAELNNVTEVVDYQIPHNMLSVMMLPIDALKLDEDEELLVSQVIAFHHEREYPVHEKKREIQEQYQTNILPYIETMEKELGISIDPQARASKMELLHPKERITTDVEEHLYTRYVLLKGLLHRLDHAASAHVPIELATELNIANHVQAFIGNKLRQPLRALQSFALQHQDHHLVVVAQTGMGKTEAGLLWMGDQKGIFTLPLRVSINAMYKRITDKDQLNISKYTNEYGEEAVGLLHSTSLDYLYDQVEANDALLEKVHSQSREFANKLIISTIDQVLKFPFYYLGFEKEFATMATCKIIIDELQAYDPKIAALLIRAMTLVDQIGGSFMIMTATLPSFYYKALEREMKSARLPFKYAEFIDDKIVRHHILIREESIRDPNITNEILQASHSQKVLVICNTVKQAQLIFRDLEDHAPSISLLHARFMRKDRSRLETEMIDFAEGKQAGIWVTTQLVEASLDIDFDVLFTEMSSLDSQFQRYGRCNRKGNKPVDNVNIYICTSEVSGVGYVYHQEIYDDSMHIITAHGDGILLESVKQDMIKKLYDEQRLAGSAFKREFDCTLEQLKDRPHYRIDKAGAQELLRQINQIQVIPRSMIEDEEYQVRLQQWKLAVTKQERRKGRREIEAYSVPVNEWRAKQVGYDEVEGIKGLYYIHCKYSSQTGLLADELNLFD